jgi:hypothetical protein
MDNIDNNIDSNSNTGCWFCQEQSLEECGECPNLEGCGFWSDDFEEDFDEFEYTWKEMSYYKFVHRTVNFKHSELQ